MVQDQGIDVYIAPFSDITKRYPEHAVPADSPVHTNDPNEIYIEAVDGERFVIVVDLLEDFDPQESTWSYIRYDVDGGIWSMSSSYSRLQSTRSQESPLNGRSVCSHASRRFDGRWLKCGFVFSPLGMDEDMEMDDDQISSTLASHGRIVVSFHRGDRVESKTAQPQLCNVYHAPDTHVSSKAVVKDNHASHAVEHLVLGDAMQPMRSHPWAGYRWQRLRGQGGNEIKFTIRYRSRDALQKLKIVPKDKTFIDITESPPPSPKVKREDRVTHIKSEPVRNNDALSNSDQGLANNIPSGEAQTQTAAPVPMVVPGSAIAHKTQHNKKRKALQDELRYIELEQKRLRVIKELAAMDDAGE